VVGRNGEREIEREKINRHNISRVTWKDQERREWGKHGDCYDREHDREREKKGEARG
jgi:hypothetical protein